MKTLTYLYNSDFLPRGHDHILKMFQKFCLKQDLLYEFIDLRYMTAKIWKEYMQKFGVIAAPMICIEDKVIFRDIPDSKSELSIYLSILNNTICQKEYILLY